MREGHVGSHGEVGLSRSLGMREVCGSIPTVSIQWEYCLNFVFALHVESEYYMRAGNIAYLSRTVHARYFRAACLGGS